MQTKMKPHTGAHTIWVEEFKDRTFTRHVPDTFGTMIRITNEKAGSRKLPELEYYDMQCGIVFGEDEELCGAIAMQWDSMSIELNDKTRFYQITTSKSSLTKLMLGCHNGACNVYALLNDLKKAMNKELTPWDVKESKAFQYIIAHIASLVGQGAGPTWDIIKYADFCQNNKQTYAPKT